MASLVEVLPPPSWARGAFERLLTPECVQYVVELCNRFSLDPASMSDAYRAFVVDRRSRQAQYDSGVLPTFAEASVALRRGEWRVPSDKEECPRMLVGVVTARGERAAFKLRETHSMPCP